MAKRLQGGVTAGEFFGADIPGGSMTDAVRGTGLGYTTVRRIAAGEDIDRREIGNVRALADWSQTVAAAKERGVWIDAAKTARFT